MTHHFLRFLTVPVAFWFGGIDDPSHLLLLFFCQINIP